MKKLTPDDLERIRVKDIANILRKQQEGRTLTAREDAKLEAYAAGGGELPESGGYAKTWDELAKACSVDRRTLTNAREQHAAEIKQSEKAWLRADGRKLISWWQGFLAEKGVRGRGANNPDTDFLGESELRRLKLKLEVERGRWQFEKEKDRHLPVEQFEHALRVMLGSFHAALDAFAGRVNPRLEGLDYNGRADVIEDELNILRRTLAECDYLKDAASEDDAEDKQHDYR